MFDVKDKSLLPYKIILMGALGLYLWRLNRVNSLGGATKVSIDTEKLSRAAMPYIPVPDHIQPATQAGLKKVFDVMFEKVRK